MNTTQILERVGGTWPKLLTVGSPPWSEWDEDTRVAVREYLTEKLDISLKHVTGLRFYDDGRVWGIFQCLKGGKVHVEPNCPDRQSPENAEPWEAGNWTKVCEFGDWVVQ